MKTILAFLPEMIAEQIQKMSPMMMSKLEELRVRVGRPLEIIVSSEPYYLPYEVTRLDAEQLLNQISQFSLYTLDEELRRGYITIAGGHRVGLAGRVILEQGAVKAIRDIASFNIRIARETIGAADPLIPYLYDGEWQHTMLIGAPQTGKTTILRDIARLISSGSGQAGIAPHKVGIVDERSEIAGCVHGVPQLQFGTRVDVLDGCPKAEGMMMMIRSMSPDVLVVDEIGRPEDIPAVLEAVNAGIKLIITTHGHTLEDIKRRPGITEILNQNIFARFIELQREIDGSRSYRILDGQGQRMELQGSGFKHV